MNSCHPIVTIIFGAVIIFTRIIDFVKYSGIIKMVTKLAD
jgi:hypothetical protein